MLYPLQSFPTYVNMFNSFCPTHRRKKAQRILETGNISEQKPEMEWL